MNFIPNTEEDKKEMLREIGIESIEKLFSDIPLQIRLKRKLRLPSPLSELGLIKEMKELSQKNVDLEEHISFLGGGAYDHFIPAVVKHILQRSEFYTSYTPYQAEASQGTLQAFYEYQTLICQLTGMEVANASIYDGASALAEAVIMASNINDRKTILVSETVHPEYREVLKTYTQGLNLSIEEVKHREGITDFDYLKDKLSEEVSAVVLQNPNFFGIIEIPEDLSEVIHSQGALLILSVDPISLGILAPPSDYGADIVVGEGQSLGSSLNFGGPYLGFFAAKEKFLRQMPGRIVGEAEDKEGRRGYVLTLQTREQHIRRERATSNICSNEALNALGACVYLSCLGKEGLKEVGEFSLQKAHYTLNRISQLREWKTKFKAPFFKEFVVEFPLEPREVNRRLLEKKIIGGFELGRYYPELKNCLLFCVTEKRTRQEIDYFVSCLKEIK
jgi:glycine dehydrogenase subunit 1